MGFLTALVVALLAVPTSPFPAASASSSDEGRLASLVNEERAARGLTRLFVASDLAAVARRHSAEMAARQQVFHDDDLPSEVRGWRAIGEVVGRGPSADAVHRGFMESASHRAQLLKARYTQIGAGAVWGGSGPGRLLYVTEVFADRGASLRPSRSSGARPAPRRPRPRLPEPAAPSPAPAPDRAVGMLLRLAEIDAGFPARSAVPAHPLDP